MTNPSPTHQGNQAYRDLLIEMQTWQQDRKIANIKFYAEALVKNELHVIQGSDFTTRKANCDVCLQKQNPGMRKFRYIPRSGLPFWFHPCDGCWQELMAAVELPALVIAQVNTNALA